MNNFRKTITDQLIKISVWLVLKLILSSLITTTTFIAIYQALSIKLIILTQFKWYFVFLSVIGGIWASIRYNLYLPTFPPLSPDFKILEKVVTYEYIDKTHMIYKKKLVLQALKNNLNRFEHRYRWSGKGKKEVTCTRPGQKFIETIEKNIFQYYDIRFERTIKKKEKIEVEIVFDLMDEEGRARPFLSTLIEDPTTNLTLRVKLPRSFGVKEAFCEISTHMGARAPVITEIIKFNEYGIAEFNEKKPMLLYHYELKWTEN